MQLVFWQESQDAFNPIELLWAKVLIPLCVFPLLWTGCPGIAPVFTSPAARAAACWMAWLFWSAFLAPHPAAALKNALEYFLYTLLFFLPSALDATQRRRALAAWLAACVLAGAYGLFQHMGIDPWRWSTDFAGRPLGTMGNPNFFGGHMVLAWGALLGLLAFGPAPARLRLGLALALVSLVQIYSRTVGVWLGMAGAAAALAAASLSPWGAGLLARWRLSRSLLLGGMAAVLLALAAGYALEAGQLKKEKGVSVTNRLMMWKGALALWKEKPLQGIGLTEYRRRFPDVQAGILAREKGFNYVVTWLPHQNFLYLLCELGLIGLGLFCAAWVLSAAGAISRLKALEPEAWAAFLGTFGMLGVSLLNTFSNIPPSAMAFWFLLGLLAFRPAPAAAPAGMLPWRPVLAVGACLSLVLGWHSGREVAAQRLLRQGLRHKKKNELVQAAAFLRKASEMRIREFTPQTLVGVNYELAEVYRSGGAPQESAAFYQRDLEENPYAPETHNMLGANLGQLGRSQEALAHLREAIRLSPGYSAAMLNLGVAHVSLRDYSSAAAAWQELLKVDSANADARTYLDQLGKMKKP